jgi:hypothetical protein
MPLTDTEKQEFATTAFTALATEKQDRLTNGLVLRQQMHDAIKRGERPPGYRPAWLKTQSLDLVRILTEIAQRFDAEHPDDRCSVSDIMDVLATTMGLFRGAAKD